jgi:RND family efflux transporter MFP subunit
MGGEGPVRTIDLSEFATELLSEREVIPRARHIANRVSSLFPGAATVVYVIEPRDEESVFVPKAIAGEVKVDPALLRESQLLAAMLQGQEAQIYDGATLAREMYAHLDLRRTLVSLALVPLRIEDNLVGAIEIVAFDDPLRASALYAMTQLTELSAHGLNSARIYERERNSQLQSISRITQFYDLEKTFNAAIELEDLLPLIASKFRELLNVQAVNLWMVATKETLLLTTRAGTDSSAELDSSQGAGGIAFQVSETGEPTLIDDPEDERLRNRNADVETGAVFSLMLGPLMDGEHCVGVVEVVNRMDGRPFEDDDLFLLTTIGETASGALHNAGLLQSERKAQVLETLVQVSSEITSTLNLDRVLQTVVNGPQAVIPFERSAIALEQSGRLQLKALSGMRRVNFGEPSVARLRDLMEWLSFARDEMFVVQNGEQITGVPEESKAQFRDYFGATGVRSFYARPLADDQGRLGTIAYEASVPDAFNSAHFELIKILAGQATVALRNAQLYQEVPFINVLEPILERKRRFMALQKRRRATIIAAAVAVVLFLVFAPVPLRVAGDATVAPMRTAQIQPEFDGVVRRVLVHEGQAVHRGDVIAEMDDFEFRKALAEAQAKYRIAVSEMDRELSMNEGTTAGIQRSQVAYWSAEVQRDQDRLEAAKRKSPIDGVVTTPFVENFTGRKLDAGDKFAEVIDTSKATVDVAVDEQDVELLKSGMSVGVKLDSYPTQTFRGSVALISPKGEARDNMRVFFARVEVPNGDGRLRASMQGRGKVMAGWHPAGYVMFRRTGMWIWGKLWSWFGF